MNIAQRVMHETLNKRQSELLNMADRHLAPIYAYRNVIIDRGMGCWVFDRSGREILDALAGYGMWSLGHGNSQIQDAIMLAMEYGMGGSIASCVLNSFQITLAEALSDSLGGNYRVIYKNSGAESVEAAIKTIRLYGYKHKKIERGKVEIIRLAHNFHGRTLGVLAMSDVPKYTDSFGPFMPGIIGIEPNNPVALRNAITRNTAGFIFEPIQGEGGVRIIDQSCLKEYEMTCRLHDILFVADEIQTGFGRTGALYACQGYDIYPDLYTIAKGYSAGLMPFSALVGRSDVMDLYKPGYDGSTHGGNATACYIAQVALRILKEEGLMDNAVKMGEEIIEGLKSIDNPLIKEVRGRGLMVGVELHKEVADMISDIMFNDPDNPILTNPAQPNVLRLSPPLIINTREIQLLVGKVEDALKVLGR